MENGKCEQRNAGCKEAEDDSPSRTVFKLTRQIHALIAVNDLNESTTLNLYFWSFAGCHGFVHHFNSRAFRVGEEAEMVPV